MIESVFGNAVYGAGGHKGGKARAANLTPEELSAIGRKGAAAKWAKVEERRREKVRLAETNPPRRTIDLAQG